MAVGTDLACATWLLTGLRDDCGPVFGGFEGGLHSEPGVLWGGFLERAAQVVPPESAATVVTRRRGTRVAPELPGLSIELGGLSGKPREQTMPVSDVLVTADGDAIDVQGRRVLLHPADASTTLHRALSLPAFAPVEIDLGAHTPRIMIDDVVYQRERWRVRLPAERGADAFDRWLAVHRLRGEHGLPRYAFVHHPAEPAPVYVDFCDPLAVEDLAKQDPAEVLLTEMLPAPGRLWWRAGGVAAAARHTRLRLGCLVRWAR
jgi:hypothetical protein